MFSVAPSGHPALARPRKGHSPGLESYRLATRAGVLAQLTRRSVVATGSKSKRGRVKSKRAPAALPVIRPDVAGVDLGSREHWVCGPMNADGEREVRSFGTTTPQLQQLAAWLSAQQVRSVAMESTGVYWIPPYELLESLGFEVLLVNARELKSVPGRKSDVLDCQWLQQLHSCGLLRGSFRPNEQVCTLRALHRQKDNLVAERSKTVQWMQKALDQMNVQVHRAVTDLTGVTGMAIVRAIVAGERDPHRLAAHRDPRCKKSAAEIAEHLTGTWRDEHLFNLKMALELYEQLQTMLEAYQARMQQHYRALHPPERTRQEPAEHPNRTKAQAIKRKGEEAMRGELWRWAGVDLTRIDGVSVGVAEVVLNEVGPDLSAFPTERDFVSWLRACPRTPFSGGKPLPHKTRGMGSTRIVTALWMAALSLSRTQTALGAYFRKVSRNNDGAVAAFATARKIATYIYRMLRYGQDYVDIGAKAYEQQYREKRLQSLKNAAKSMGCKLVPDPDAGVVSG